MATTGSKQGSPGVGTTNWDTAAPQQSPDRASLTDKSSIKQTLRDTTFRQLDDQKVRASETVGNIAGAVRGMTQPLRESGQGGLADYVNQAADGIERWASDFKQQDIQDALRAVQRFARRQPALFLGAAFTAGMLTARFLKSSGDNGQHRSQYNSPRGPRPMGTSDFASAPYGTTSSDIPRLSSDRRPTGEVI